MIKVLENMKTMSTECINEKLEGKLKVVSEKSKYKAKDKDITGIILDARKLDLTKFPKLKVISRVGVGKDNLDLKECKRRKIKVYMTPCDELTNAVAEFTVSQILILLRKEARGQNLYGKAIGIIGYGRIGMRIEFLLGPFVKNNVLVNDIVCEGKPGYSTKEILIKSSDIIIITVSGDDRIIGEEEIKLMKRGTILVNMARQNCIDEKAVFDAIMDNTLYGVITDVNPDIPFGRSYDWRIMKSAHVASSTYEAREKMELLAVENLIEGLK